MKSTSPESSPRGVSGTRRNTRWHLPFAAGLSLLLATACDEEDVIEPPPTTETPPAYEATIRRTAHGIPHITAKDMGSLGYGQGYAFARDHVCILADQIIKVRGERARYLGQGPNSFYAGSDFAYRSLGILEKARASFDKQPAELQAVLKGYAAGYNRYLSETPPANLPAPCTNADWVKPIDAVDVLAYDINIGLTGSTYQLILAIAAATPPTTPGGGSVGTPPKSSFTVERPDAHNVGSNGWAIGAERSANGRGMVVANPHFPWEGELKLWESQLTVPGELNIYGVGLMGVPAVLIGFNENVAWTHTFSFGQRMTLYGLQLVPGNPTRYKYGNEERDMTYQDITIQVKLPEGSLTNVTRRMYSSHYGPVIVIPGTAEWTPQTALSYRDANLDNTSLLAQYLAMNKARSMQQFQDVYANVQGIPWVNTMAADREGNVWYTDASPTPNLSQEALATWQAASNGADATTTAIWRNLGLVLLNGSNPTNEWQNVAGARSPGLVPYSGIPKLSRRDFVFNSNDSYWLANPNEPIRGVSPMHGLVDVPQSPRTRMNATLLMEQNGASGADYKFTTAELENAILSNRGMLAELLTDAVVQRCQGKTTGVTLAGKTVDIRQACTVLASWDKRYDSSSVGAHVWREFAGYFSGTALANSPTLYAVPFDAANPIATPNTLSAPPPEGTNDAILGGLARATDVLATAGVPMDKPLGEVQFTKRVSGQRIPIHGGNSIDGTANVVSFGEFKSTTPSGDFSATRGTVVSNRTGLTTEGYVVNAGSSFIMAMEFTDTGVNGRAVLTYSESSDPKSPYFSDQTQLFSNKQWRPIIFSEADIAAAPGLVETKVSGD